MDVLSFLRDHIAVLDGAMGTMLQNAGMENGVLPEKLNLTDPELIISVHKAYFDAGSNIVCTNTFGANLLKYSEDELDAIIPAAIRNAKEAARRSVSSQDKFIALNIGPTGKMLKPLGDLDFEEAVRIFSFTARLGEKNGADLILIETMNDSYETKAALLAAKESASLPVFVSNAYGGDGKLLTGATPEALLPMLEGLGADAVGINCSLGPDALLPVLQRYLQLTNLPVFFKPNAGLPVMQNGKSVYNVSAEAFAASVIKTADLGVNGFGGCCGTNPDYIRPLAEAVKDRHPVLRTAKRRTVVTSYANATELGDAPVLIGERINPTGKKRFRQALLDSDFGYILQEAVQQQENGARILDVNVGIPEIDETSFLSKTTTELQAVTELPLQIDTTSVPAMELALRRYNGKAMINSVNGKEDSMRTIFPLAKKYGGVVVALTLDENGIPETAAERLEIAKKILQTAHSYGIQDHDLVFDPLCMAVSAMPKAAGVTLESVKLITEQLHCCTVLGVSNVSFGLPERCYLNSAFLLSALTLGLSAAIANPFDREIKKAFHTYAALNGFDAGFADYIGFAKQYPSMLSEPARTGTAVSPSSAKSESDLQNAVIKGIRQNAVSAAKALLSDCAPLDIIKNEIIPALNTVGEGFERKEIFLPQLLMSAEAAAAAFEEIKPAVSAAKTSSTDARVKIILLTVQGDIHDIGKNIVKLLLQNFGFDVMDLGKDVAPRDVLSAVKTTHAGIVGLSALMTTTLPAMEETVALLHKEAPWCKIIVGGAVLTPQYAASIGADRYAKDAMETVRYAQEFESTAEK